MDMKYMTDIKRLNKGCDVIKAMLVFKRQIRTSEIKALWFFQTPEEKALAIEYAKSFDADIKSELISREPIMEWNEIIRLNSFTTPANIKQSKAVLAKIIPLVKERIA